MKKQCSITTTENAKQRTPHNTPKDLNVEQAMTETIKYTQQESIKQNISVRIDIVSCRFISIRFVRAGACEMSDQDACHTFACNLTWTGFLRLFAARSLSHTCEMWLYSNERWWRKKQRCKPEQSDDGKWRKQPSNCSQWILIVSSIYACGLLFALRFMNILLSCFVNDWHWFQMKTEKFQNKFERKRTKDKYKIIHSIWLWMSQRTFELSIELCCSLNDIEFCYQHFVT